MSHPPKRPLLSQLLRAARAARARLDALITINGLPSWSMSERPAKRR